MQKCMVCFGEGAMELCMHENPVYFFPVNIPMAWCAGFLVRMVLIVSECGCSCSSTHNKVVKT